MNHLDKKYYQSVGIALTVIGVATMGLGVKLYMTPDQEINLADELDQKKRFCQKALTSGGLAGSFERGGKLVRVKLPGLGGHDDPQLYEREIHRASYLVGACSGYQLESFCIGEECGTDKLPFAGVEYTLSYKAPSTNSKKISEKNK